MRLLDKLSKSNVIKGLILTAGLTTAMATVPAAEAHHGGFNRGIIIGGIVGLMAGAAIANSSRPYYPSYDSCRQVVVNCYTHYSYEYGPERVCTRHVDYVC